MFLGFTQTSVRLDTLLGNDKVPVAKSGLKVLASEKISYLLKHPQLLLPLQTFVLLNGGSYWQDKLSSFRPIDESAGAQRQRLLGKNRGAKKEVKKEGGLTKRQMLLASIVPCTAFMIALTWLVQSQARGGDRLIREKGQRSGLRPTVRFFPGLALQETP